MTERRRSPAPDTRRPTDNRPHAAPSGLAVRPNHGDEGGSPSKTTPHGDSTGEADAWSPHHDNFQPLHSDGATVIEDTVVEARLPWSGRVNRGDYLVLVDMDVLAVISNCPEALNPAAGGNPTPVRAIRYRSAVAQ